MNTRRVAEWVLPLVALAVTVVLPTALADRLPDPVASHWGSSGMPDGSMPRMAEMLLLAGLTALLAVGPLVAASRTRSRQAARGLVAAANAGAGFVLVLRWATLQANLDAPSWQAADALPVTTLLLALLVAVPPAVWGWLLSSDRPDMPSERRSLAAAQLTPGQAVVWSGHATGTLAQLLTLLTFPVLVVAWFTLPREAWLLGALTVLVVLLGVGLLARVAVTIGPSAVRVRLGWLGLPRITVPLEQVTGVSWEDVEPMRYGGWGYRVVPGTRAVLVRRGEGLRISRWEKPDLLVTVDGAAEGGGVLLAHLARPGSGSAGITEG